MRAIQKYLVDFDDIDSFIAIQKFVGCQQLASQLFNAKHDIIYCYDRQAQNYSLLITFYENQTTTVHIVSHNFKL